ncbi:unnamed protein product [Phytomonas sp. Hart1]|nr:unnamed protein product [Phytomonas sp. Hart1]|eukprot:CCW69603.1 unnamed protein product [Phytomonas sp. isolate Hart1]
MKQVRFLLQHSYSKDGSRVKRPGSLPNFPSDILSKVYHEAVRKGKVNQQGGEATGLEGSQSLSSSAGLGLGGAVWYSEWRNTREVTNHVGELGVMSPRAAQLREKEGEEKGTGLDKEDEVAREVHPTEDVHESSPGLDAHPIPKLKEAVPPTGSFSSTHSSTPASSDRVPMLRKPDIITSLEQFRALKWQARQKVPPWGRNAAVGVSKGIVSSKMRPRHSGVQLQILNLYRRMLKEAFRMHDADTRSNLQTYIRSEFDKNVDVSRKHVAKIEWCINTGKRKLEDLQLMNPNTKFCMKR